MLSRSVTNCLGLLRPSLPATSIGGVRFTERSAYEQAKIEERYQNMHNSGLPVKYSKWWKDANELTLEERLEQKLKGARKNWDVMGAKLKEQFVDDIATRRQFFLEPRELMKIFEFNNQSDLEKWTLGTDSAWDEGYSTCKLRLNDGFATFSGYIDSVNLPLDGRIYRAGWANMTSKQPPYLIRDSQDEEFECNKFTHMRLRIRGDGRRYAIVCGLDKHKICTQYGSAFCAWLPTHGGPYWQEIRIPWSRFFKAVTGMIQDDQDRHEDDYYFKSIGISIMDNRSGPFKLDVQWIGCEIDLSDYEVNAYEGYTHPAVYFHDTW